MENRKWKAFVNVSKRWLQMFDDLLIEESRIKLWRFAKNWIKWNRFWKDVKIGKLIVIIIIDFFSLILLSYNGEKCMLRINLNINGLNSILNEWCKYKKEARLINIKRNLNNRSFNQIRWMKFWNFILEKINCKCNVQYYN